jgi:hypothetical protein
VVYYGGNEDGIQIRLRDNSPNVIFWKERLMAFRISYSRLFYRTIAIFVVCIGFQMLEVAGLLAEASRAAGRKQPAEHWFGYLIAPWRVSVF